MLLVQNSINVLLLKTTLKCNLEKCRYKILQALETSSSSSSNIPQMVRSTQKTEQVPTHDERNQQKEELLVLVDRRNASSADESTYSAVYTKLKAMHFKPSSLAINLLS